MKPCGDLVSGETFTEQFKHSELAIAKLRNQ